MENKYRQSFSIIFILNLLGISVPEDTTPFINYSFEVLFLSIGILFGYLNSLFSLLSLYFLSKYNINEKFAKYPILIKIIKYYHTTSLINIILEVNFGIFLILILIFGSLSILGVFTYFSLFK